MQHSLQQYAAKFNIKVIDNFIKINIDNGNNIFIDIRQINITQMMKNYELYSKTINIQQMLIESSGLLLDILQCFINHPNNNGLRAKEVQNIMREYKGGNIIDGKEYSESTFNGKIRTCLMEHSSDSRQHYYRGNVLQPIGWRKNIFSNSTLGNANNIANWKPYSTVRGRVWKLKPGKFSPSTRQLKNNTVLFNGKIGMRGFRKNIQQDSYSATYSTLLSVV